MMCDTEKTRLVASQCWLVSTHTDNLETKETTNQYKTQFKEKITQYKTQLKKKINIQFLDI